MNFLIIALDTQRRDHLGCYGYLRDTSPTIDALAAEGVVFESCVTNTAHTMPTFTTMVSGQDPSTHGIVGTLFAHPNEPDQRFDDSQPVLAELLRDSGYTTAAFDNLADFGCHPSWFTRGYQFYVNIWAPKAGHPSQVLAEDINEHLLPWLTRHGDEVPWFLFVHYWDPHQAYNQPEPYRTIHAGKPGPEPVGIEGREHIPTWGWTDRLTKQAREKIDLYDGELSYVDNAIAQIIAVLRRLHVYDETAIIVTADHGEDLEEHNAPFEHREPYESTVGIPLVCKPPAEMGCPAGSRVASPVGNCDLLPSILDMAGIDPPEDIDGKSWLPLARAETDSIHNDLFLTGGAIKQHGTWVSPELGLRTDQYKYIRRGTAQYHEGQTNLDITCLCAPPWRGQADRTLRDRVEFFNALPRQELYDLIVDPHETTDIAAQNPSVVAELDARLQEYVAKNPKRLIVD